MKQPRATEPLPVGTVVYLVHPGLALRRIERRTIAKVHDRGYFLDTGEDRTWAGHPRNRNQRGKLPFQAKMVLFTPQEEEQAAQEMKLRDLAEALRSLSQDGLRRVKAVFDEEALRRE